MKQQIASIFLFSLMLCSCHSGCKSTGPQTELKLREGVVDIPVETAPGEIWLAAQVWGLQKSYVSVVVSPLNDGSRTTTYFLDIGFEQADGKVKREDFHRRLGALGWKEEGEGGHHTRIYSGKGRRLQIGFDTGMHPTSLIVNYEKENTQHQDASDG